MRLLEEHLAAWEAGGLSLEEVERRHPDEDVQGLADLHITLSLLTEEGPPSDADRTWSLVEERLGSRSGRRSARVRPLRTAVAAATAVLVLAGGAYAAGVDPVREAVDAVWDAVTGLFAGEDSGAPPVIEVDPAGDDRRSDPATDSRAHTGDGLPGDPDGHQGGTEEEPSGDQGTEPAPPGAPHEDGGDQKGDGGEHGDELDDGDAGSDEHEDPPVVRDPPDEPVDGAEDGDPPVDGGEETPAPEETPPPQG